mmetsp:Transcript_10876/g.20799  ORF Transcript_10876/g.20799 Transcript_10876/m.20799 type:complete len:134 (-) Transcript_10876:1451-1852(-)
MPRARRYEPKVFEEQKKEDDDAVHSRPSALSLAVPLLGLGFVSLLVVSAFYYADQCDGIVEVSTVESPYDPSAAEALCFHFPSASRNEKGFTVGEMPSEYKRWPKAAHRLAARSFDFRNPKWFQLFDKLVNGK